MFSLSRLFTNGVFIYPSIQPKSLFFTRTDPLNTLFSSILQKNSNLLLEQNQFYATAPKTNNNKKGNRAEYMKKKFDQNTNSKKIVGNILLKSLKNRQMRDDKSPQRRNFDSKMANKNITRNSEFQKTTKKIIEINLNLIPLMQIKKKQKNYRVSSEPTEDYEDRPRFRPKFNTNENQYKLSTESSESKKFLWKKRNQKNLTKKMRLKNLTKKVNIRNHTKKVNIRNHTKKKRV